MELKVVCYCGQKYKFDVEPSEGRMPFTVNCPVCGVDGTPLANQLLREGHANGSVAPSLVVAPPTPIVPSPVVAPITPVTSAPIAAPPLPSIASAPAKAPPPATAPRVAPPMPAPPISAAPVATAPPAPIIAAMAAAPSPAPAAPSTLVAPPSGVRVSLQRAASAPPTLATTTAPSPLAAPRPIAPIASLAKPKAPSKEFSMGLGILGAFLGAVLGAGLTYAFFMWVGFRFPWTGVGIGALAGYGARLLGRGTDTTLGAIAAAIAGVAIVGVFYLMYGGFFMFGIISIIICIGVAYRLASE